MITKIKKNDDETGFSEITIFVIIQSFSSSSNIYENLFLKFVIFTLFIPILTINTVWYNIYAYKWI